MTDSKPLAGKLALVTGASRGIGAATAEALAAAGAHVILVARTAKALEEVEERIHAAGGSATIAPLDLIDGDLDRQAGRRRSASAGTRSTSWSSTPAMLGSLTPVEHIDAKEYGRVLATQPARPAGPDRRIRSDAAQGRARRRRRHHLLGRAASRAPSGAPTARPRRRSKPCCSPMPTRPSIWQGPSPYRRSRRHPHPHAANWPSPARNRTASSRRRTSPRQSWSEFSAMRRPVRRCGSRPSS